MTRRSSAGRALTAASRVRRRSSRSRSPRLTGPTRAVGACACGPQPQAEPPAGRATPVACRVADDPQQPRPERRALPEPIERAICLHECLLRRVLGLGGVAEDEIGGPKCDLTEVSTSAPKAASSPRRARETSSDSAGGRSSTPLTTPSDARRFPGSSHRLRLGPPDRSRPRPGCAGAPATCRARTDRCRRSRGPRARA